MTQNIYKVKIKNGLLFNFIIMENSQDKFWLILEQALRRLWARVDGEDFLYKEIQEF
jgi:hypothetical protein